MMKMKVVRYRNITYGLIYWRFLAKDECRWSQRVQELFRRMRWYRWSAKF